MTTEKGLLTEVNNGFTDQHREYDITVEKEQSLFMESLEVRINYD